MDSPSKRARSLVDNKNRMKQLEQQFKSDLEQDKAKLMANRRNYLARQSALFLHFMKPTPSGPPTPAKKETGRKRQRLAEATEDAALMSSTLTEFGAGDTELVKLTASPPFIKGTMRDYQIEGLNWMIQLKANGINGILADEMGLGKTLQSISILGFLQKFRGVSGPHVVVAPKSTLSNWVREIHRWCPTLRALKFHGTKDERAELIKTELVAGRSVSERTFDVCVTSYEIAIREKSALKKFAWQYLIIDEAHRIKNEKSLFSRVIREYQTLHRLLLTGTPLQNNLHELWALLNYLLPEVFHSSEQFDEWFNLADSDDQVKEKMINQLHKVLRPFMLRRLKVDVAKGIPPKVKTHLYVGMSEMQREMYKSILQREFETILGSLTSSRVRLSNILMQLRKVCAHPYLFEGVEDRSLDPNGEHLIENCGKMVLLDKLLAKLKQRGNRVLIFSQMTRLLDILEDYCNIRGFKYCRIDGQTSGDDRESQIDDYNAEGSEIFVFLLSTRAGGLGINLYTADTVILYDSDWNPQVDLQAEDRAHRIGQKRTVNVYRLVTDMSVEVKILERAEKKLRLDTVVVQQGRLSAQTKNITKEEMLDMVRCGASEVFRAGGCDSITDDDIDSILDKGKSRTKAMQQELEKLGEKSLLDFRLNAMNSQEFEGTDYSNRGKKNASGLQANLEFVSAMSDALGKRQRKTGCYNDSEYYKRALKVPPKVGPLRRLPKTYQLPKMNPWQFYDVERLQVIAEQEARHWDEHERLRQKLKLSGEPAPPRFEMPADLATEKAALLAAAFPEWKKTDLTDFVSASERFGRHHHAGIASALTNKSECEVRRYAAAFWTRGSTVLAMWPKYRTRIVKGEARLQAEHALLTSALTEYNRLQYPLLQLDKLLHSRQQVVESGWTRSAEAWILCWVLDRLVEVPGSPQITRTDTDADASPRVTAPSGAAAVTNEVTSAETTKMSTILKFPSNCWMELSIAMSQDPFLALDNVACIRKPNELRQRVLSLLRSVVRASQDSARAEAVLQAQIDRYNALKKTDEELKRQLAALDEQMKQRRQAVIAKFSVKKTPAKKMASSVSVTPKRKRKHDVLPPNLRESLHDILSKCDLETTTFTQVHLKLRLLHPGLEAGYWIKSKQNRNLLKAAVYEYMKKRVRAHANKRQKQERKNDSQPLKPITPNTTSAVSKPCPRATKNVLIVEPQTRTNTVVEVMDLTHS